MGNENTAKNKRTKKSAIAAGALAAVIAISGAFAFMSDHDNAINKFNFTNSDGDQSIDIQLSESEWVEENGQNILYGTPVAKNPVATNTGENEMYAFASVILPAKGVTVQNASGQIVDVNDVAITDLAAAGIQTTIVNNVSTADASATADETEILGVYKDADLTEAYEFGEDLPQDGTTKIYFKLSSTSPLGTAVDGQDYKVLEDTVDVDNYTSDILGHQFMLKLEDDGSDKIAIRELYTLEVAQDGKTVTKDDVSGVDRIISGAWDEFDVDDAIDSDTDNSDVDIYSRSAYHNGDGEWVDITESISDATVYVDGAGRIYSAHVFYYTTPLAKGESSVPVFDAVELINVNDGQIMEEDDMNIYVETYGVQTTGIGDALGETAANTAEGGVKIWDVLTNAENQTGFDLFGVVKDTQDDTVATYVQNGQNVANDYAVTTSVNP